MSGIIFPEDVVYQRLTLTELFEKISGVFEHTNIQTTV